MLFRLVGVFMGFYLLIFATTSEASRLPVFPGAKGFGAGTPAGRSGCIVKVTNLNDSGPGSLREAINRKGPRIIVFEVSGRISLKKPLTIKEPFITIAGQSAPEPGVMITDRSLEITTNDVLIQHLAIRVGDENKTKNKNWGSEDGIKIMGENAKNIVLDHISVSWSIDELISTGYGAQNITISNSIISQALDDSVHPKGKHGYLILGGEKTYGLSLINNLVAHGRGRMPRLQGGCFFVANCIFYNKGGTNFGAIGSKNNPTYLTLLNNVFVDGPSGKKGEALIVQEYAHENTEIFAENNRFKGSKLLKSNAKVEPFIKVQPLCAHSIDVNLIDVDLLENNLIKSVGSRPNDRDRVDTLVIDQFTKREGNIINSQQEVGGFPSYKQKYREFKPCENPSDDNDGDGYTNIEEMLHFLSNQLLIENTKNE